MKIDLELTWMEILNMARSGVLKASDSDLEKACQVADIIRQAQKDGANYVKFVFVGGEIEVEIDSGSIETWKCSKCGTDCSAIQCPADSGDDLIEETDYLEEDEFERDWCNFCEKSVVGVGDGQEAFLSCPECGGNL